MYYYYRKGAEREKVFLFFSSSSTLGVHSMVAITLRPGGAPSTPREHHDEALKSKARAPFGGGGGGCSSSSRWVELWCRFLLSRSFLDAISKCWWFLFQVLCARAPDRVVRQARNENKTDCLFPLLRLLSEIVIPGGFSSRRTERQPQTHRSVCQLVPIWISSASPGVQQPRRRITVWKRRNQTKCFFFSFFVHHCFTIVTHRAEWVEG